MAKNALTVLHSLPVRWHRKSRGGLGGGHSASIGGFVSGLFGGSSSSAGGGDGGGSWSKVDARLDIVDTMSGPAVQIAPEPEPGPQAGAGGINGEITMKRSAGYIKTVPLKKVGEAAVGGEEGFLGIGGSGESAIILSATKAGGGQGEELLRFELIPVKGGASQKREDVVDELMVIVEWDRRRRAADPDYDDETEVDDDEEYVDEDDGGGGGKKKSMGRAARAAHFAKREIEMQKQKREREKRKARYLKDGGGLKYTAIAMANRTEEKN